LLQITKIMPIKSYLAHPSKGKKEELSQAILALGNCEVVPSENEELLIVVTDTDTVDEDIALKEKLDLLPNLELITLVTGYNTLKK